MAAPTTERIHASPRVPTRPLLNADLSLSKACRIAGVRYPPTEPRLVVVKEPRTLALYAGKILIKEYAIGLGRDPIPHKQREGDGRTPVGEYYLCTRVENSRFHRFMGVSYPGPADADAGRKMGAITEDQAAAIRSAHDRRARPPWDTALGGEIGIHGGGSGTDWTLGCIAIENDAIEELFDALPVGAPVRIE